MTVALNTLDIAKNVAAQTVASTDATISNANSATQTSTNSAIKKTNENSLVAFEETSNNSKQTNAKDSQIALIENIIATKQQEINSVRSQMYLTKDRDEIVSINSKVKSLYSEIDTYYEQIMGLLMFNDINAFSSNGLMNNYGNMASNLSDGTLGGSVIATAQKYLGFNEADGSYKKFTGGRVEAWCADFVTYVVKEAYAANGKQVPSGFGSPAVNTLESWGKNNGRWISKDNLASVKPGDIMIQSHHTGIVTSVNSDGTISTIEGNTSNTVARRTQYLSSIEGFVSIA